jgi:hypothetical protein
VAQARLPSDRTYDGVNLLPYLTGANSAVPNPRLYWRNGTDFAMRDDDMKLWIANIASSSAEPSDDAEDEDYGGGSGKKQKKVKIVPKIGPKGQDMMLFNLRQDLGEKHNLAAIDTADVSRLQAEIKAWNDQLIKPQWPAAKHSTVDYDGQTLELFY